MKKIPQCKICFVMVLFLLASLFTSCSPDKQINNDINTISESEQAPKINIQYAQWSVTSTKIVEGLINRFNQTNKENIRVHMLKVPLDRYMETLNMLNSSGDGPDVSEIYSEWLETYISKDYVANLSEYIDESFIDLFPQWVIDLIQQQIQNNKMYSIPATQITYRLIYNRDLFKDSGLDPDSPPKTLSEFKQYAKKISDTGRGKRKYGFAQPMGELWIDFVQTMEAVNGFSGIYYYNFPRKQYNLTVYEPWLKVLKELKDNGGIFPGMESMKSDLALSQFAEGNIGMMYAASWQVSTFFEEYPPKCDWGVALPPAIDEASVGEGEVGINTAGWNIVNYRTKHLEEAAKVWNYLYSKEYLGELYKEYNAIPLVSGSTASMKDKLVHENFISFLPGINDAVYPDTPLSTDEWLRKNAYVEALTGSEIYKPLFDESYRLNSRALLNPRLDK